MRSLFAKTLLWFLATTAVAIAGIIVTTALTFTSPESRQSPFGMLLRLQVDEAKHAYETGGRDALGAVLAKYQQVTSMQVVFTDAKGTDLLTGESRAELLRRPGPSRWRLPFPFSFGRRPII